MEVNRNDPGNIRDLRSLGPLAGQGRPTRGQEGKDGAQDTGNDRSDRVSSARDRRELFRTAKALRARLAAQGQGASPERSDVAGNEATRGPSPERIQAIRLRRARIANANQSEPPATPQTPPTQADRVDISNGGLTVDEARARIARLRNFISNQLGGPTNQPEVPAEPPAEPPTEQPPAQEEGLSIDQMLQRIARLMNAFANGWEPGQGVPGADQPPATESTPQTSATAATDQAALAEGTPTVEALGTPNVESFERADQPVSVSGDSFVLSAGAAVLSNAIEQSGQAQSPAISSERLAALREAYQAGTLNTAEMVQRAADQLLTVESERLRA